MKSIFGLSRSADFSSALEKTFAKFDAMPAEQILALGQKHVDGDIAKFSAGWPAVDVLDADELTFVFNSVDGCLQSFHASFVERSTLRFNMGSSAEEVRKHSYGIGTCYLGVPSMSFNTPLCHAA